MAVQGDVEHAWVLLKDLLGAVAVVNIPVQDQHPERPPRQALAVPRRHRHVVEEAEAAGGAGTRVVPGGAHDGHGVADLPHRHIAPHSAP